MQVNFSKIADNQSNQGEIQWSQYIALFEVTEKKKNKKIWYNMHRIGNWQLTLTEWGTAHFQFWFLCPIQLILVTS